MTRKGKIVRSYLYEKSSSGWGNSIPSLEQVLHPERGQRGLQGVSGHQYETHIICVLPRTRCDCQYVSESCTSDCIFHSLNILTRILLFIYSIVLKTVNCILCVEHPKFCYSTSIVISTTLRLGQQGPLPLQVLELLSPCHSPQGQGHVATQRLFHLLVHDTGTWDSGLSVPQALSPLFSLWGSFLVSLPTGLLAAGFLTPRS